jgi:hypothetical protein
MFYKTFKTLIQLDDEELKPIRYDFKILQIKKFVFELALYPLFKYNIYLTMSAISGIPKQTIFLFFYFLNLHSCKN